MCTYMFSFTVDLGEEGGGGGGGRCGIANRQDSGAHNAKRLRP